MTLDRSQIANSRVQSVANDMLHASSQVSDRVRFNMLIYLCI
jgi:hypothetical protein